jgi:ATP phosphoribosyltransferase
MAASVPLSSPKDAQQIHLALPKGHMQENVFKLFADAGIQASSAVRARST